MAESEISIHRLTIPKTAGRATVADIAPLFAANPPHDSENRRACDTATLYYLHVVDEPPHDSENRRACDGTGE